MTPNLDTSHRLIRLVLGTVLALVQYKLNVHVGLYILAGILGLTGIFGFCPVFALFKKS